MTRDAELLREFAAAKSQAAFAEYVERNLGFVYSTALRVTGGDAHAAADVAQQVFLGVARDARRLADHPAPVAWLHVTTRNAARSFMRSESIRRRHEQSAAELQAAELAADWEKVRPLLDDALLRLGEADREAVLLRFFAGHPFAEIGRRLHVPENTARMRVERALDKLHGLLAARGVASTSAALGAVVAAHASSAVPGGLAPSITAAVAAAPVVGAVGLLSFMSTAKTLVGLTSALALGGLAVGLHEWRDAHRARQSADTSAERVAALEGQLRTLTAQLRDSEQHVAALVAQASRERPPAKNAPANPSAAPTTSTSLRVSASPFTSPEYVEATQKKYVASLPLRYGPLYRKLGLSAEQIATFERALAERNQISLDIWTEAAKQGLSSDDPSILRMTTGPILESQAKLRAALGEGFSDYIDFDKTYSARSIVASLAGSLYYTDTPLTAAQGEALANAVARNTEEKKRPLVSDRDGKVIYSLYTETNWEKVREAGLQTLAPAQLKALQHLIEQSQQDARITEVTAPKPQSAPPSR